MTKSSAEAEKANLKKPQGEDAQARTESRLARLSLVALEVVFGDIATFPGFLFWKRSKPKNWEDAKNTASRRPKTL